MSTQGQGTGVVNGDGGMPHPPSEARRPRASEAMPRDGDVESMDVSFYISFGGICFMTLQIPMGFCTFQEAQNARGQLLLKTPLSTSAVLAPLFARYQSGNGRVDNFHVHLPY